MTVVFEPCPDCGRAVHPMRTDTAEGVVVLDVHARCYDVSTRRGYRATLNGFGHVLHADLCPARLVPKPAEEQPNGNQEAQGAAGHGRRQQ